MPIILFISIVNNSPISDSSLLSTPQPGIYEEKIC